MTSPYHAQAFGCRWQSAVPLPPFEPDPDPGPPDITVSLLAGPPPFRRARKSNPRLSIVEGGVRFIAGEVATIDTHGGSRVHLYPGPLWSGQMPVEFFGTVAGALLSARGALAMHGSAVEIDGRAVLLCGSSGAGKSTLSAALIARGARLISDDLSVLYPSPADGIFELYAGRRTMRLFPDLAEMLAEHVPFSSRPQPADRKLLVVPPRTEPAQAVPLGLVVVLGQEQTPSEADLLKPEILKPEILKPEILKPEVLKPEILEAQMYRPQAYARAPGHLLRRAHLRILARTVPLLQMAAQRAKDREAFEKLAVDAEKAFRSAIGSDIVGRTVKT